MMFRKFEFRYCLVFSILILVFFALVPSAHAGLILGAPKYVGLEKGLVGYWSFNGPDMAGNTAYDRALAPEAQNGTLTNGPVRTEGRIGQALDFPASDDAVSVADTGELEPSSAVTMSVWTKPNVSAESQSCSNVIAGKEFATPRASPFVSYTIGGCSGLAARTFEFGISAATVLTVMQTPSSKLEANTWVHLALTYNGANMIGYVNGVNEISAAKSGALDYSNGAFVIGADGDLAENFNGVIDEVRIYNRALSADEVKRLYNLGR